MCLKLANSQINKSVIRQFQISMNSEKGCSQSLTPVQQNTIKPSNQDNSEGLIYVTFKKSMTKQILAKILNQNITDRLNTRLWRVDDRYLDQFKQLFTHMEKADCQQLFCSSGLITDLRFMSPPCYANLKQLELPKNKINSIESLTFLNIDFIQKIFLTSNEITQIKSLSKVKWSNLKMLDLAWNHIQYGDLENFKTGKQFTELSFDMNPLGGRQMIFFVKLEPEKIQNLDQIKTHKMFYIRQESVKSAVMRKYIQVRKYQFVGFGNFWRFT